MSSGDNHLATQRVCINTVSVTGVARMQLKTSRSAFGGVSVVKAFHALSLATLATLLLSCPLMALATGAAVTVKTDQPSYSGAQSLTVSGTISPAPSSSGTNVVIKVSNPSGREVLLSEAPVSTADGSYSLHFVTGGPNWVSGTYLVNATYVWGSVSGVATNTFTYSPTATTTSATSTSTSTSTSSTSTHPSSTSTTTSSTSHSTTTTTSSTSATSSTAPSSTTTSSTSSSVLSTTTNSTAASSTSSAGGGIPEFPFQVVVVCVFTAVVALAYVAARSRMTRASGV